MLDGRQDIRDCLAGWDSNFVIRKKGHGSSAIPEYADLRGRKDIWGQSYDSEAIGGLGAVPHNRTSMVGEAVILDETDWFSPYYVAVHEFAHHIMNLCFDRAEKRQLDAWLRRTEPLGLSQGIVVNRDEFFAEFTAVYFEIHHSLPRRFLDENLPELFDFMEDLYGRFELHQSATLGFGQFVSQSGIAAPWLVPVPITYVHPRYRYKIELPSKMSLEYENPFEVEWLGRFWFSVEFRPLAASYSGDGGLQRLAADHKQNIEDWIARWPTYKPGDIESVEHAGAQWLQTRYYAHEAPRYCAIYIWTRSGIVELDDEEYGVQLYMRSCEGPIDHLEDEWQSIANSFVVP